MKVGVLTGGGDCPGLNAVIRAVVRTAYRKFADRGVVVVGIQDGFLGMIEDRMDTLSDRDVSGILPRGGTILGTSNRDNPFAFATMEDGVLVHKDLSDKVMANLNHRGIKGLIVIGGDGSLTIAERLSREKGIPVVGVPKTIDNDLSGTDTTFGFNTALTTATEALDRIHTTADSHHRVMVVEVMGRYAGWIGLESGLASGADVILIPEIPFHFDAITSHIERRRAMGCRGSIVVVAEGAYPEGGDLVVDRIVAGSPEPKRLGGISRVVAHAIEDRTGIETRVTILGHVQRGGSPSPFDRILGTRLGVAAMEHMVAGHHGVMMALRTPHIVAMPLSTCIEQRRVDPQGEEVQAAMAMGVSLGV